MPPRTDWHLYREPYFGGGSVLLRMDGEGVSEAVNDQYGALVDFWAVLAETPDRMLRELWGTPFSQEAWEQAIHDLCADDRVRRATAFFVRARQSRQGLMKDFATPTARVRRGMNENVSAWLSAVEGLSDVHRRLKRVEIRCMDAIDFIKKYDHPQALFYCDPPYLHETRQAKDAYEYEMSVEDHRCLLESLAGIQGKFLLSGYHSELYGSYYDAYGWSCDERIIDNKASGAETKPKKTECLWMNF